MPHDDYRSVYPPSQPTITGGSHLFHHQHPEHQGLARRASPSVAMEIVNALKHAEAEIRRSEKEKREKREKS